VAVAGGGSAGPADVDAAHEVGRLLASAGLGIVCGGLGGVMEAACRGARSAGGLTVGLLPGDDPSAANPFVDVPIPTGLGEARNLLVARTGAVLVAIGGEHGTLSEIGFALRAGRPVVGLRTWGLVRPDGSPELALHLAPDPAGAVELALSLLGGP
jgi:uncharacterized protein (TIGR00725 family)